MDINVGDIVSVTWTAPDIETDATATVKVNRIQETPIKVIFGEQQ